jgi:NADP-dependent 3-hydroxy acid dehydrogenase YdfG
MSNFNEKAAVINGGSGTGLATAKEIAANGARIVIAGRERKYLDASVREIGHEVYYCGSALEGEVSGGRTLGEIKLCSLD